MQSATRHLLVKSLLRDRSLSLLQHRNASLTGAIHKGIRKGQRDIDRHEKSQRQQSQDETFENGNITREIKRPSSQCNEDSWLNNTKSSQSFRNHLNSRATGKFNNEEPQKRWNNIRTKPSFREEKDLVKPPTSVPYTTAESDFLYGTFAIEAALKAKRRKLYRLYIYHGQVSKARPELLQTDLRKLAENAGVQVVDVGHGWGGILAKMTNSRPHNGYILETSPILKFTITGLHPQETPMSSILFQIGQPTQSGESTIEIPGHRTTSVSEPEGHHYPFMLLLDRIVDVGNFGAILRSAYFLGVDAVIILEHGTAPLSGVTSKASGGAMEYIPLLQIKNEVDFIKASKANGWTFFAATTQEAAMIGSNDRKPIRMEQLRTALSTGPCVLMLGNEGEGLRPYIQKLANKLVSIQGAGERTEIVDSLNVSVAAGLLIHEFLRDRHKGVELFQCCPKLSMAFSI